MPFQSDDSQLAARERVLQAAERLFTERGYAAVTLRDIAEALGIRQASLYYHAPGGKEELFVQVTERGLERHRAGLETAISQAGDDLREQLRAAARWLLSQPAMNFARMLRSDMPAIRESEANRLRLIAYQSLIAPLEAAFRPALLDEPGRSSKAGSLAGAFLSIIEGVNNLPESYSREPKEALADFLIDTWIDGLRPRP
ncbi:MAG: TetR/AcrR family transcriptional regulator [Anaerolineae bacterium]|nr:TetR/AcrR family transcriptional regulator [Anaerolineae bacterium]